MNESWYNIKGAATSDAEISLYGAIGREPHTAVRFIETLKAAKTGNIKLRIHSPGGGVFDGNAIYNAVLRHKGSITTHIDGLAASMATVIALAGKTVHMARNALFMIHNPTGLVWGDARELEVERDLLEKIKGTMLDIYAGKTSLPREKLARMMDEETWLTAEQAKAHGFVDVLDAPKTFAATIGEDFDLSVFRRAAEFIPGNASGQNIPTSEAEARYLWARYQGTPDGWARSQFLGENEAALRIAAELIENADAEQPCANQVFVPEFDDPTPAPPQESTPANAAEARTLWDKYDALQGKERMLFLDLNGCALQAAAALLG